MVELEFQVVKPELLEEKQPEYVHDGSVLLDCEMAILGIFCDLFTDLEIAKFEVKACETAWNVDVWYDLSTILPQIPYMLELLDKDNTSTLDFFAQGTEKVLTIERLDEELVKICCYPMCSDKMLGKPVQQRLDDFIEMLKKFVLDFSTVCEATYPELCKDKYFLSWKRECLTSFSLFTSKYTKLCNNDCRLVDKQSSVKYSELELFDDESIRLDGKPYTGIALEFDCDGNLVHEITFQLGLDRGPFKDWDCHGNLVREGSNLIGFNHATTWYPNGLRKKVEEFHYGYCVSSREWDSEGNLVSESILDKDDNRWTQIDKLREHFRRAKDPDQHINWNARKVGDFKE